MTLMEVLVALSVITTGVVTGLTLTSYNLTATSISETQLIAANLAREGLEAIRQIRDANWLKGNVWNAGIVDPGQYRLTVDFDAVTNNWIALTQTEDIEDCADCRLKLDKDSGVYSHGGTGGLTNYKRLITVQDICWQEALSDEAVLAVGQECADFNQQLIGWQLESAVTWSETVAERQINMIDRLYDWR